MRITDEQFRRIEGCFPVQRCDVWVSNLNVLDAIVQVAETGCMWRSLPERHGRWHTIQARMDRWAEARLVSEPRSGNVISLGRARNGARGFRSCPPLPVQKCNQPETHPCGPLPKSRLPHLSKPCGTS